MNERESDKELEARLFAAELSRDCPELDLHGEYPEDVESEIDRFLAKNLEEDSVRIIHGVGKGVLARAAEAYLKKALKDGLVDGFRSEQGGGSVLVILKK